jgi:polar amino acid transport system substrate-binding protein
MFDRLLARRRLIRGGSTGLMAAAAATVPAAPAAAQASPDSLLRKVLDRGCLIVGTGSSNAPWHFEDEPGRLTGMDIAMARILAKGLFDDESLIDFVRQDPAARIPNITTGKVDAVIQFMTIAPTRAQLVAYSRPYFVEGLSLLMSPHGKYKTYDDLIAAGNAVRAFVLQNRFAEQTVSDSLPHAQAIQLDTQANVIQAVESWRADVAMADTSTVAWLMMKKNPGRFLDAGHSFYSILYGAALRQGDPDWLHFVDTAFTVQMHGHITDIYDHALKDFFGMDPPVRKPGFPAI